MENAKKLYVIDGNSLLFRAYFATAWGENPNIMTTREGIPTNAIFAFANMLTKILQGFKGGESLFIGFDSDKQTFRKEEFADYKANRKPCPPELIKQFPISREFLKALNILHYEEHGFEADDLCGTIAVMAAKEGYDVQVFTSDKDYLQLISDNITVNLLKTGLSNIEVMTPSSMQEIWGFGPKQIIDYKGLFGDSSDNLPGISGIGDKTAKKLIADYGSFDEIIAAAKDGRIKGKMGENIIADEEKGRLCFNLATIKTDVDLPFSLEAALYEGYDFEEINRFAQKYELKQMMNRLPSKLKKGSSEQTKIEVLQQNTTDLLRNSKKIGVALDMDFGEYHTSDIYGVSLSDGDNTIYISSEDIQSVKTIMEDDSIKKSVFDVKATVYALARKGICLSGVVFDPLLAAYLLDSSANFKPRGVFQSFGIDLGEEEASQISLFGSGSQNMTGKIAYQSLKCIEKATTALKENEALDLLNEIELPLAFLLAQIEGEGFPLDKDVLAGIGKEFKDKLNSTQAKVIELAGKPFNVSSPKQVAEVLFKDLGLGDPNQTSTSVEVLEAIKDKHPIVPAILEYRKYSKLVGTYIDGLLPHVGTEGKIHTYFNQAQTTTGRLSSSSPNLQNISTRDEESRLIRKAFFYPDEDSEIVSFDYGQIELRILASLAGCKTYSDIFQGDRDIHTETAKKIFMTDEPTHLQRRRAKAVNFAIIYGTTVYGLSEQIGSSPAEAGEIIQNFYASYPEVRDYLDSIIAQVERTGYVKTMFGRRRYLRDITDPNYNKREAAKRAALNAPVQGSAADLIKIAMLKVNEYLKSSGLKTKMVLQIHDELVFRMPNGEKEIAIPKIKEIMEGAVELPVKLTVEVGEGKTWYDAKD